MYQVWLEKNLCRVQCTMTVTYCFSDNRHNLGNSVLCAHHIHLVKNRDGLG